jgi:hypothetical protein
MAETSYTNPMTKLFNALRKVLKDNKVATDEQVQESKRISKMVNSMIEVQKSLVN